MTWGGGEELGEAVAVGAVGPRSARLWFRATAPGPFSLVLWPAAGAMTAAPRLALAPRAGGDGTHAFEVPGDVPGAGALEPLTRYRFRVLRPGGEAVGEGAFETSPEGSAGAPAAFSFGLVSCHQPFDPEGRVRPASLQMLRALQATFVEQGVKRILWCGDQVYADEPAALSLWRPEDLRPVGPAGRGRLEECSAEEVRRLYQERYRRFWGFGALQALQAQVPGYYLLDDHEVVNDWGSRPEHASAAWAPLREGALGAYFDYQGSRVRAAPPAPGEPFDFHFDYGPVGVYALDVRSQRRVGPGGAGQVYSPGQLNALARWLEAHRGAGALFVVVGVPPAFLSLSVVRLIAATSREANEAWDRWSHPHFVRQRDALLRLLGAHQRAVPHQRLVVLSGDVHVGSVLALRWAGAGRRVSYQLTSSALTHVTGDWRARAVALLAPWLRRRMSLGEEEGPLRIRRVAGGAGARRNPCGALNAGLVEVRRQGEGCSVRLKLLGAPEGGRLRTLFDSGEL